MPLQVAALPIRRGRSGPEILIVQTRTGRWTPPKGWPERGRGLHEVAAEEAWEEGGVSGTIHANALGAFRYRKRLGNGEKAWCAALLFLLQVSRDHRNWPERYKRNRVWVNAAALRDYALGRDLERLIRKHVR